MKARADQSGAYGDIHKGSTYPDIQQGRYETDRRKGI